MSIREVVTLISLLSSLIHLASPTLLDLHLFPSTNSTLLCNDGTPSGYYFRPADPDADEEAANLWIVQQEAGGWCWDPQSCVDRILGLSETSPHLISSNSWAPQRDIKGPKL